MGCRGEQVVSLLYVLRTEEDLAAAVKPTSVLIYRPYLTMASYCTIRYSACVLRRIFTYVRIARPRKKPNDEHDIIISSRKGHRRTEEDM